MQRDDLRLSLILNISTGMANVKAEYSLTCQGTLESHFHPIYSRLCREEPTIHSNIISCTLSFKNRTVSNGSPAFNTEIRTNMAKGLTKANTLAFVDPLMNQRSSSKTPRQNTRCEHSIHSTSFLRINRNYRCQNLSILAFPCLSDSRHSLKYFHQISQTQRVCCENIQKLAYLVVKE